MSSLATHSNSRPDVALIVETSVVYGREILKGVSRYLDAPGKWSVFLDERELDAPPPDWIVGWTGQGILCRSTTPDLAALLKRQGTPVVDLNDRHGDLGLPRIASDMRAIGRMAGEYMRRRGFSSVGYCGFEGEVWCAERLAGVSEAVEVGSVFHSPWSGLRTHAWQDEREALCNWLLAQPRPLAVITCNDVRGYHVLDACRALRLAVPEEVAVLGVDNAEAFCTLCDPPLSSVVPDAERVGFQAAQLLDRLMSGKAPPGRPILIPPTGVVTRQSTDSVAISDPLVARATQFIRENGHRPIGVDDLTRLTGASRSTLERRFRSTFGHSPHDEICAARLKRVKSLLIHTNWPLHRVAEETGYEHAEYMMVQFKRAFGKTPTEWRLTR